MTLIKVIGNEKNKLKNHLSKNWDYWEWAENKFKTWNGYNKSFMCIHNGLVGELTSTFRRFHMGWLFWINFSLFTTLIIVILCFEPVLSLFSVVSVFADMKFKLVFSFPATFINTALQSERKWKNWESAEQK